MGVLVDTHQRRFTYLRLSVTEVCNFKCNYCLPQGYQKPQDHTQNELTLNEVKNLLHGFGLAGFKKVRFTGGEPTTRSDLLEIISTAQETGYFSRIAISTNGWNLKKMAPLLRLAGITHINVSVDSLNPKRFESLTGKNTLPEILEGVEKSLTLGFERIKINSVIHKENTLEDFTLFLDWIKHRPVSVRFIELMKTGDHARYHDEHFISSGMIKQKLLSSGWKIIPRINQDGPAVEFSHPNYLGSIGIIAPYSQGFCESCNRLRVTSEGKLRMCLFGDQDYSIRNYFQTQELATQLPEELQKLLMDKPATHFLHAGNTGNVANLSRMGG